MSLRGLLLGLSALLLQGCAFGTAQPEVYVERGQGAELAEWIIRESGLFRDPGPLDPARNIAGLSLFGEEWWDPATHVSDLRLDLATQSGLRAARESETELAPRRFP